MRECVAILFVSLSDLQNSNTVNALPTGQNIIVLGKAPLEERSNILAWLQSEPAVDPVQSGPHSLSGGFEVRSNGGDRDAVFDSPLCRS